MPLLRPCLFSLQEAGDAVEVSPSPDVGLGNPPSASCSNRATASSPSDPVQGVMLRAAAYVLGGGGGEALGWRWCSARGEGGGGRGDGIYPLTPSLPRCYHPRRPLGRSGPVRLRRNRRR